MVEIQQPLLCQVLLSRHSHARDAHLPLLLRHFSVLNALGLLLIDCLEGLVLFGRRWHQLLESI